VSAIKALRRNARVPFDIGDGDHAIMERCDPNLVTMRLTSLSVCSGGRLSTCEWSVAGESLRYVEPNRCLGYNRIHVDILWGDRPSAIDTHRYQTSFAAGSAPRNGRATCERASARAHAIP